MVEFVCTVPGTMGVRFRGIKGRKLCHLLDRVLKKILLLNARLSIMIILLFQCTLFYLVPEILQASVLFLHHL